MVSGSVWGANYPSEQDYLQEFPVVLSASRLAQPISETPNAMTVIDHDMIAASGFRNIADLFKLVPGMYVSYANGHTPVVSYRGTTDAYARRMQVLIDGRTVYLPPYGTVDWEELPLDIGDIERIEVVRGPSAASHGSNSVQGVISIFTRQASAYDKAQVSVGKGDAGISDVSARFGNVSENWDYRVTLASRKDNGFDGQNDSSTTQLVNLRSNYRFTAHDSLDLQLGYSASSRGMGILNLTAPGHVNTARDMQSHSDFQQLNWLHTIDGDSDVQLSYYHIRRSVADNRYTTPFPVQNYFIADETLIHRHELELQHTLLTAPTNRIVWGLGMRRDAVDSASNFSTQPRWREYRLFAHDEWRTTPSALVNIGAMVEKNALGQTRVSPRIAYNHHLSPRHTLRASVSVAYRNPEMVEEFGDRRFRVGVGQLQEFKAAGGLSPERALSREIGYVGQLDETGSTIDIRAYHDQISNIIWVDPVVVPGSIIRSSSFKSLFSATYTGMETTLNYKTGEGSKVTLNYAHQVISARPAGVPTLVPMSTLNRFVADFGLTMPLNSASILFSHDFAEGTQLGIGFYHQDKVQVLDAGRPQPLTRRLDLRIAKQFGEDGKIALVVQNALSDHYTEYNTAIVGKRRAYLTATLEF
ncbi:hypothetical protein FGKAn22_12540 [Ferrigenium kumadai]|uniref:TonB-dependent receptor n=1 Tax=Ferrigenium kumadai TaxID=1682490 RepID=A0AAN1W0E3_9PROT|nr:TonB-dependent receptor [Ferrigenium kumadai]BBI99561.1 hypothetical protein FGKAn22_12540 [Ferrigenium kumadai]